MYNWHVNQQFLNNSPQLIVNLSSHTRDEYYPCFYNLPIGYLKSNNWPTPVYTCYYLRSLWYPTYRFFNINTHPNIPYQGCTSYTSATPVYIWHGCLWVVCFKEVPVLEKVLINHTHAKYWVVPVFGWFCVLNKLPLVKFSCPYIRKSNV